MTDMNERPSPIADRQRRLMEQLAFLDSAKTIAGVDRAAVVRLVDALRKIANCATCPGCRREALNALGIEGHDGYLEPRDVMPAGRSEHHRDCIYYGDGRIVCHADCPIQVTEGAIRV